MTASATTRSELELTVEDYDKAFADVSFLLSILTRTVGELVGEAAATVGRVASQHMARKLPFRPKNPSLEEAIAALVGHGSCGSEIAVRRVADGEAELGHGRCVVRDVCGSRGEKTGGGDVPDVPLLPGRHPPGDSRRAGPDPHHDRGRRLRVAPGTSVPPLTSDLATPPPADGPRAAQTALVVCLGNPLVGDDQVGWGVASRPCGSGSRRVAAPSPRSTRTAGTHAASTAVTR